MIFNDETRDYLYVLRGRDRPAWSPVERYFVESSNLPGGHLSHSKKSIRRIKVPIRIVSDSFVNLQKVKEDMANWLVHDEPKDLVFKDEPDRVYYALVDGGIDLDELIRWGEGILEFVCPDPFKYAKNEKVIKLTDNATVENKGSEITYPKIKMVAKKASTFAMINNPNDEYMLLGIPTEVEEKEVAEKTLIFEEQGDTINQWSTDVIGPDGNNVNIGGSLVYDGTGVVANGFGSSRGSWHGPSLIKSIPATQDFEVEAMIRGETKNVKQTFRIEIYYLDEAKNILGKMAIVDNMSNIVGFKGEARYGPFLGGHINYPISSKNYYKRRGHFHGMLRFKRIGKRLEFYIARVGANGHSETITRSFNDNADKYAGKLRYIQIHMAKYDNSPNPGLLRLNSLKVYRHNKITVDQTPYLVHKGDVLEFDHDKESISLNGENVMHIKDFGANFFGLNSGINTLTVSPENTFDTEISYRERYK